MNGKNNINYNLWSEKGFLILIVCTFIFSGCSQGQKVSSITKLPVNETSVASLSSPIPITTSTNLNVPPQSNLPLTATNQKQIINNPLNESILPLDVETKSNQNVIAPGLSENQTNKGLIEKSRNELLADHWREWPVVPQATDRSREIYTDGVRLGSDPHHFSKIGDCQSIHEVLLGRYDFPDRFPLTDKEKEYGEAIAWFTGSYGRDGMAVQGGFNAASVISPLWANPDYCQGGETPLECEFRIHRPSLVFISLEVWFEGRTTDRYEKYMRNIIEYSISHGAVPILSTKADNVEGDHSINLTTAKLAQEYDLPLWNFWRAAQLLPNRGMDPERDDGFHISKDAWLARSFTALQTLDTVWKGASGHGTPIKVEEANSELLNRLATEAVKPQASIMAPSATIVPTAIPTATPAPKIDFNAVQIPGKLVFSIMKRESGGIVPGGVFSFDFKTGQREKLADAGWSLQNVSSNGRFLIINKGNELSIAGSDGGNVVRIADNFFPGNRNAAWLPDGTSLIFIANQNGKNFLVLYPLDGSGWQRLTAEGDNPIEIYPYFDSSNFYWEQGNCAQIGVCTNEGVRLSHLGSPAAESKNDILKPAFSPDQTRFAYSIMDKEERSILGISNLDGSNDRKLPELGGRVLDYSWSMDGQSLAVLLLDRSDYNGRWNEIRSQIITPANLGVRLLPPLTGLNARTVWSPDSKWLIISAAEQQAQDILVTLRLIDLNTGTLWNLDNYLNMKDPVFTFINSIYWINP